ncbi:MAG: ribonuclease HI family protein [Acidobacteriia bacterium]|nr:ribonuclease HI family protein [Terriglobia bacterium]
MTHRTAAAAAIDGGARGNPGEAGCGILLQVGRRREEHTLYLGTATNNVAEYAALLAALERAQALGVESLEVKSDSQLLVEQMNGGYKVKAAHLKPLWLRARTLAAGFRRFAISHVSRTGNRTADELANRAMDERVSTLPRPEGLP